MIRNFISENIILRVSDLITGQNVHRWLAFLRRSAKWTDEEMVDFQNRRFSMLVQYAATQVPYYREWFRREGAQPADFRTIDDLRRLPIVDKAEMRRQGVVRFMAEGFPASKRMAIHSSGSTGEPFEFYVSTEAYSINMAAKLRTWYDAGYRLGNRYVKLSSSPRESWLKRLQDQATNGVVIPFHSLDDESLADILALIDRHRPNIIRTHPNAIYYLARYREAHPGHYLHRPRHIMTTSANLPDTFRTVVEHVFGCDVIDAYSCEGTPNTAETPAHDGYHVSREYGIIEVLDDEGHHVQKGIGHVVSTDLWNMAMPFIRYDTQYLVQVDNGTIVRIAGRECELLSSANGKRFTGQVIDDYFNYCTGHSVDAFQVVRRRNGSILMRLMVNNNFTDAQPSIIAEYWHRELDMPVTVEIVDRIPLMHNNKYLTIVDE